MEPWKIYEAYGAWVAEDIITGRTIWALSLDELKRCFKVADFIEA